jgi:hypothetical protein
MRKAHLGVLFLIAALPVTALAQTATPPAPTDTARSEARAKMRAACAPDVQKFCANVERAKGAMRSCLETHKDELSTDCKAARAEREAARKEKS